MTLRPSSGGGTGFIQRAISCTGPGLGCGYSRTTGNYPAGLATRASARMCKRGDVNGKPFVPLTGIIIGSEAAAYTAVETGEPSQYRSALSGTGSPSLGNV